MPSGNGYAGDSFGDASKLFLTDQEARRNALGQAFQTMLNQQYLRRQMQMDAAARAQNAGFTQQQLDIDRQNALTQASRWQDQNDLQKQYYDWIMNGGQSAAEIAKANAAKATVGGFAPGTAPDAATEAINRQAQQQQWQAQDAVRYGNATLPDSPIQRNLNAALQPPTPVPGTWTNWILPPVSNLIGGISRWAGGLGVPRPDTKWAQVQQARIDAWRNQVAEAQKARYITPNIGGGYSSALPQPAFPRAGGSLPIDPVQPLQPPTAGVPATVLPAGNRNNIAGAVPSFSQKGIPITDKTGRSWLYIGQMPVPQQDKDPANWVAQ